MNRIHFEQRPELVKQAQYRIQLAYACKADRLPMLARAHLRAARDLIAFSQGRKLRGLK